MTGTPADTAILVERPDPATALIRLNRPERLNSFTFPMLTELAGTLRRLAGERSVRAVVLTGQGPGFCSGADFEMIQAVDPATATIPDSLRMFAHAEDVVRAMLAMPQPVIAAVNGPAFGGGFSLTLASDIRICSPSGRFCASFVKFGIAGCELGVSYLLPKIVGASAAFEMMLTGRTVHADEAARTGLVLEVVEPDALLDRALEIARLIASNSPFGVEMTKRLMWRNLGATHFEGAMELEMNTQALLFRTEDHREAVRAFREGRPADFGYR